MNKQLISVIVPVYNVEEYLNGCIDSIVNQTYKNLEIILVDDGSTDSCPKICDQWSKKDKRIRVIHKKNGGVSSARNLGLEVAKGSYISFVDSDDYLEKNMYSTIIDKMCEENCDIIAFNYYIVDKKNKTVAISKKIEEDFSKELLDDNGIRGFVWNKVYTKKILDNLKFELDVYVWEDLLFNFEIFNKVNNLIFKYINQPLYYYFQRNNSCLNSPNEKMVTSQIALGRIIEILDRIKNINSNNCKLNYIKSYYDLYINFSDSKQFKDNKDNFLKNIKKYKKENLKIIKKIPLKNRISFFLTLHFPYIYVFFKKLKKLLSWEKKA